MYSLPSEAQWEWAAPRGNQDNPVLRGQRQRPGPLFRWFSTSPAASEVPGTTKGRGRQPVAKLKPNSFGLYDMLGNVWEWCGDRLVERQLRDTRTPGRSIALIAASRFNAELWLGMNFLVDQFDGATAASVPGGRSSVVLLAAAFHVLGDAGVKRAIGAPHDVHEPSVDGLPRPRVAGLARSFRQDTENSVSVVVTKDHERNEAKACSARSDAVKQAMVLKRVLLFSWAVWLSVVFLSNLADALKESGLLGESWTFASGN